MSGSPSNRTKKNGKKTKFLNIPEVLQVKSVKLQSNRVNNGKDKSNAKSADNINRKWKQAASSSQGHLQNCENDTNNNQLEARIVKNIKKLTLNGSNDSSVPSSSLLTAESSADHRISPPIRDRSNEVAVSCGGDDPLVMDFCPETFESDNFDDQFSCTYKYYSKNTKSIKFTNQVTVLYFNGEDILCESMEPLKKELDQQLRNKEMRKEHLLSKGREIDNVYLF